MQVGKRRRERVLLVSWALVMAVACDETGCEQGADGPTQDAAAGADGGPDATPGTGGTGGMLPAGGTGGSLDDAGPVEGPVDGGPALDAALLDAEVPNRTEPPPCITKPTQVIVLGDSYVNYTPDQDLLNRMAKLARADGALGAAETWRLYAQPGWSMGSGGLGLIPTQLTQALIVDADIKAGVMTGGGNDVLIPWGGFILGGDQCKENPMSSTLPVCQQIVKSALDAATMMMKDAAAAGIRDVVYFFYPHLPGGGLGGANPNVILDYAYPLAKKVCDDAASSTNGQLYCHFLDTRALFDGKGWISADGVHPTPAGSDAIAEAVWEVMKDECIAQPPSSGCCTP